MHFLCYKVNQQWLHYERGDFSTSGFPGDSLYPKKEIGTTLESNYSRPAQSKQEMLCGNVRGGSKDSKKDSKDPERGRGGEDDGVDPSTTPSAPIFTYSLPGRTTTQVHLHHHYHGHLNVRQVAKIINILRYHPHHSFISTQYLWYLPPHNHHT